MIRIPVRPFLRVAAAAGQGAAAPAAAPVLDPAAIDRLRELDPTGAQGVVPRVLRAYENALARQVDELEAAWAADETDKVSRITHTLKSSSASVGALVLSRMCAEIERALRSQRPSELGSTREALIHEARQVLTAVRAILPA